MSPPTVVPSWRLAQALAFAVDVHALQERKGAPAPDVLAKIDQQKVCSPPSAARAL